ncbi:MAG: hypothetical protein HN931_11700 [Desulfobacterales bacterium]|jgi:hypothetical protein|nr:hypothetical protein [Desulfobacteraceae bacterium]MBT7086828.1 hypothetical protein [Desulfobacterales bacterium]
MADIRMNCEIRTDYDCEASGLPAERWGEAVFNVNDEELILEVSVEESIIVAIMAGEDAVWKGTLEGLKKLLRGEIKAR